MTSRRARLVQSEGYRRDGTSCVFRSGTVGVRLPMWSQGQDQQSTSSRRDRATGRFGTLRDVGERRSGESPGADWLNTKRAKCVCVYRDTHSRELWALYAVQYFLGLVCTTKT